MSEKNQNKNKNTRSNINGVSKKTRTLVKTEDIEDAVSFFSKDETHKLRAVLLDWYDNNHRVLPWRTTLNDNHEEEEVEKRAYGVWVSEEVNEIWAGLGYYRRARFLLEGAKKIVAEGGSIPKTASMLRKIPGIGDYTSGAIASIAFKEAVPVVDGNVIRVIARLKAVTENPKDSAIIKRFWEIAAQLVDPLRPGDFNQALMELGATVCTPLNPSCSSCPATEFCHALSIAKRDSTAAVTDYPVKGVKVKQRSDFCAVCVVELLGRETSLDENHSSSKFVLVKRPDGGLLAGLWEFPSVLIDEKTTPLARRKATDCFLKKNLKIDIKKTCDVVSREDVGEFVHIFSHIRLKLYVELLVLQLKGKVDDLVKSEHDETITWKCVDSDALSSMGLTTS
ncbi:hypothetical protein TSUD_360790, partial [Trifolium subterraneum]